MMIVGRTYLQSTLKSSLEKVLREKKPCEIDPKKIADSDSPKSEVLKENLQNLKEIAEETLSSIVNSASRCPLLMCQMFSVLKQLAEEYFPTRPEVKYSVMSGFVFLRFFTRAIGDPKKFDLVTEPAGDAMTSRTLVLLSKIVQSLGNHVAAKSAPQVAKEDYMSPVMERFVSPSWVDAICGFLETISTFPVQRDRCDEPPMLLREGWMMKKSCGKGNVFRPRKSFTNRHFTLTTTELRYAGSKDSKTPNRIPASHILDVERMEDSSFSSSMCMSNLLRIKLPNNKSLIIQAKNCVEQKQWMESLNRVRLANANRLEKCHPGAFRDGKWEWCAKNCVEQKQWMESLNRVRLANANRLEKCHPGAFRDGKWECCESYCERNRGCEPVTTSDVRLNIDVQREMECIYNLCASKLGEMRGILSRINETTADSGMCGSGEAIYFNTDAYGVRWYEAPDVNTEPEFSRTLQITLQKLCEYVEELLRIHTDYLDDHRRRNRIGSLQFPIGEENYPRVSPAKQQQVLQPLAQSTGNVSIFKTRSSPG
ncbi:unnamed protein product [Notodromas monacha]|uniref:Uncharacterized protein n=1 Tax=Notodromas monacha TaxID=399045 RepID=A0A7R9GH60_9CRUS|nr:unnamed protein product [Notodromas monacha]CAG0921135.1 unnamed protein product [Notodromas monacha]